MRSVVFLDFDGVLHPAAGPPGEISPFEWVPQLWEQLQPYPDVAIVIHSTWREVHTVDEMRGFLGSLAGRVVGVVDAGEKAAAILAYLRAHPEIERSIVIDDAAGEFQVELPGTILACDPLTGICGPDAQTALRDWLRS
jgi:hypothetical protein